MSNEKRLQQIRDAARYKYPDERIHFIDGAKWADSHPQWIPVEEERPKFDWKDDGTWSSSLPILIYSIHGISIGTFQLDHITGKAYWFFDGSKHEEFMDKWRIVTHWMPLPEAPRKEENNESETTA